MMERLQGIIGVPLSGAQNFFPRYDYGDIVSRRAIDIVQPDVVKVGGISELMRVADLASVWGLKCKPHVNCGSGHDIQVVATARCLAAMSNGTYRCYPAYDTPDGAAHKTAQGNRRAVCPAAQARAWHRDRP